MNTCLVKWLFDDFDISTQVELPVKFTTTMHWGSKYKGKSRLVGNRNGFAMLYVKAYYYNSTFQTHESKGKTMHNIKTSWQIKNEIQDRRQATATTIETFHQVCHILQVLYFLEWTMFWMDYLYHVCREIFRHLLANSN